MVDKKCYKVYNTIRESEKIMSIDLKSYVDQNKAVFLPGYMDRDEVPSDWAEFINYIDFCYKQQDPDQVAMHKEEFMKGGRVRRGLLQIWGYMTIFAENPSVEYFPKLRGMIEKAVKDYGGEMPRSSFALTNFSSAENITNRHDDLTHNLYFQCIGSVTWKIYSSKDQDATYESYDLSPGDAIWVPSGVSHEVTAHMPRTAITIAFHGPIRD